MNTAGWLAPVIRVGNRCFVLGSRPNQGFNADELDGLAKNQHITLLSTSPPHFLLTTKEATPTESDAAGEKLFSLPWYVFYARRKELADLESKLGVQLGEICVDFSTGLTTQGGQDDLLLRLVDRTTLQRKLLRGLFESLRSGLHRHLRPGLGVAGFDANLAYQASGVLYQFAYNRPSAREAIALHALTTSFQSGGDLCLRWISRAAPVWGLKSDPQYWKERIQGTVYQLWIQRQFREAISSIDVDTVTSVVLRRLLRWGQERFRQAMVLDVEDNIPEERNMPSDLQRIIRPQRSS